jgi:hypothetical protein
VVKHLRVCPACYQFAKSVKRLEKAWRNLPLPEECDTAKANFLAKLDEMERPQKSKPKRERRPRQTPSRRPAWGMRGLAIAASIFIGVIAVGFLLPGRSNASTDVVDRLVDWNMRLANAEPKERKELLAEYESFRTDLRTAKTVLAPEDYQLADYLLDTGRKLASTDDPFVEADAITGIANKLFSHAEIAVAKGNETETERCGARYGRFNSYAVKPMWEKRFQFKGPEMKGGFDKDKGGFDKDKGGFDKDKGPKGFDKAKYDEILKRSPEFSNPGLHSKFDGLGKKGGPGMGPGPGFGPGPGPGFGPKGKR